MSMASSASMSSLWREVKMNGNEDRHSAEEKSQLLPCSSFPDSYSLPSTLGLLHV